MADFFNIKMEGDKALIEGRLFDMAKAKHLLRDAIDDIADAIEDTARANAPGSLKEDGIDRDDTRFGIVGTGPAYGGGTSIHGAGGRFVGSTTSPVGELIARSTITIPEEPKYAIWVHDGTGVYGPRGKKIKPRAPLPYFKFGEERWPQARFKRKFYRLEETKGQKKQPYLKDAFLLVDRTFVPVRIGHLRAQIAAET